MEQISLIAMAFNTHKKLTEIDLSKKTIKNTHIGSNKIESEEARLLGDALKTNKTITTLNLAYNNLEAIGAINLAEMCAQNGSIVSLNLRIFI